VPILAALPLAGAVAAIAFGLQNSLAAPVEGSLLASQAVGRLEQIHVVSAIELFPGAAPIHTRCTTRKHVDRLFVGGRLRAVIQGAHFVGRAPSERLVHEAELAGCTGLLVDELTHRLRFGMPTLRRRDRFAEILRAHGPGPYIDLVVARRSLSPVRLSLVSATVHASARIVPTPRVVTDAGFLQLAETGLAQTERLFWNTALGWYDERPTTAWNPARPLARLWAAFPLFEALDAVATADPSEANLAAVSSFAKGAERYFDPNLSPSGGYVWYPDVTNPHERAYFDDNGWWELAYLDAFRATGDPADLTDAEKAFAYIAEAGWDPRWGGTWWETLHFHKTSEPLAAEIYTGFALYRQTGDRTYLDTALKFLRWANVRSWNAQEQLYARNPTDPTVLDYVEGMMIGADLELCEIRETTPCTAAENLARASVAAFPHDADWTPAADVIYLRFLLDLYRYDGNPQWYDIAYDNAMRALTLARSQDGLYFKRWDGKPFPYRLMQPDAATLSLFAWLGTVPHE
jgi:hypothetical protein